MPLTKNPRMDLHAVSADVDVLSQEEGIIMVKPYKPPSVVAEEQLDKLVKGDAPVDKSIQPTTPMVLQPGKPKELKPTVYVDRAAEANVKAFEAVIVQLQNIWEKVVAIELIV